MTGAVILDNAAWSAATPAISVLTPFLRDDPTELLVALEREAPSLAGAVEIVLLDDGTADIALTERLAARIKAMALPVRLMTLARNEGRSDGRNRLAAVARGPFLLFLDSDMRPDHPAFLADWVQLARSDQPAVAFGGFSLEQARADARFAVHRSMAAKSDCVPATERRLQPEKYVFTSNLLVRRDVFESEAFDSGFKGWGWEDVEWAMRVSRRFQVVHVENTATHMGLDTVPDLIRKYQQAAPNFALMAERHPGLVAAYPSHRAARLLRKVPGLPLLRRAVRATAETAALPVALRAFALRLYRTTLYAEVV